MDYVETMRAMVGHAPLMLVRPSVILVDQIGGILLVRYADGSWGIPGGMLELGETVEECAKREVKADLGIQLRELQLVGVYSGEGLRTVMKNGDECYHVVIAYLCSAYEGILRPDGAVVLEADFFHPYDLPEKTIPVVRQQLEANADMLVRMAHAVS